MGESDLLQFWNGADNALGAAESPHHHRHPLRQWARHDRERQPRDRPVHGVGAAPARGFDGDFHGVFPRTKRCIDRNLHGMVRSGFQGVDGEVGLGFLSGDGNTRLDPFQRLRREADYSCADDGFLRHAPEHRTFGPHLDLQRAEIPHPRTEAHFIDPPWKASVIRSIPVADDQFAGRGGHRRGGWLVNAAHFRSIEKKRHRSRSVVNEGRMLPDPAFEPERIGKPAFGPKSQADFQLEPPQATGVFLRDRPEEPGVFDRNVFAIGEDRRVIGGKGILGFRAQPHLQAERSPGSENRGASDPQAMRQVGNRMTGIALEASAEFARWIPYGSAQLSSQGIDGTVLRRFRLVVEPPETQHAWACCFLSGIRFPPAGGCFPRRNCRRQGRRGAYRKEYSFHEDCPIVRKTPEKART